MKNHIELSDNEKQILDTLWREERPLSRSEIIELTENKTWKESSIHILLNQLLDKRAIDVDGFVKTGRNYGRTYSPLIDKNDYDEVELEKNFISMAPEKSTVSKFLSFLAKSNQIDKDDLNELRNIIDKQEK